MLKEFLSSDAERGEGGEGSGRPVTCPKAYKQICIDIQSSESTISIQLHSILLIAGQ